MTVTVYILTTSMILFAGLCWLFVVEDRNERRVVLSRGRHWLDTTASYFVKNVTGAYAYLTHGVVRKTYCRIMLWVWRMIHAFSKAIELRVSQLVARDRKIYTYTSSERSDNHLDRIREHKTETALSPEEHERRRSHD